jgi:hypothetical protein
VHGVGYGMEMDLYMSRILDGVLMGSCTKTKLNELVSQIACICVSIFFVLNAHIPVYLDSRGEALFLELFFGCVCLS